MKDYTRFLPEDFVADEYFQSWVLNPDEQTEIFWQSWMQEHPGKVSDIEEARNILQSLSFPTYTLPGEDVSLLWNRIRHSESKEQKETTRKSSLMKIPLWYRVAAAMLLIGITVTFFLLNSDNAVEYRTAFGENKTVQLPDGSTVKLNGNSLLRYAGNWSNEGAREVWLDGEAFFAVTHTQNNQTFRVNTDKGLFIEVLGTTFNVNHRQGTTKVVLRSGKIQLGLPDKDENERIVMDPGDLVEYKGKEYVKRKVDPQVYSAWTENKLVFNHTSLREIIDMLSDNYGIEVNVRETELLEQTVSGSMPVAEPDKLVQQVATIFQLQVVREDGKIFMVE